MKKYLAGLLLGAGMASLVTSVFYDSSTGSVLWLGVKFALFCALMVIAATCYMSIEDHQEGYKNEDIG